MIKFLDSLDMERGIEFSLSYCGKYINLTQFDPKSRGGVGRTVQIPVELKKALIDNLEKIK